MDWSDVESAKESSPAKRVKLSSTETAAIPILDHAKLLREYATPSSVPLTVSTRGSNIAEKRLTRLQNALQGKQNHPLAKPTATHQAVPHPKSPAKCVSNRLVVTPNTNIEVPIAQATKRKAITSATSKTPLKLKSPVKSVNNRLKVNPNTSVEVPIGQATKRKTPTDDECGSPVKKKANFEENVPGTRKRVILRAKRPALDWFLQKDLSKCFYVVIDTNVFCHNLIFVNNLLNMDFCNVGSAVIIIPYIVLQELDTIKHQSSIIEANCKKAIKFINEKFQSRHLQIKGQSAMQAKIRKIDIVAPDDSIINCCLQIKEKINQVILLSNDVNLRNKAICNEINALSPKDLREDVAVEFL
ncbi:hypothetical protein DMENIID0001_009570 [Sergentomyia squamirostris]